MADGKNTALVFKYAPAIIKRLIEYLRKRRAEKKQMDAANLIQSIGIAASVALSGAAFVRTAKKDDLAATDERIDERISLRMNAEIAVINVRLADIQNTISQQMPHLVRSSVEATAAAISEAARTMNEIRK